MLKSLTKQTTLNATSVVKVDNVDITINYMSASIDTDGRFNINQSIQNEEVYFDNLDEAKSDYDNFYNKVVEIAKEVNN